MKFMKLIVKAISVVMLAAMQLPGGPPGHASELRGYRPVPINNGPNRLRVQGHDMLVFRAWRGNYNAHGFDAVTLYLLDKGDDGRGTWTLVPVFTKKEDDEKEHHEITVSGGADCLLHDFRLLIAADKVHPPMLVIANRDAGASFADPAAVHFEYYELAENVTGTPGWPHFYFKATRSATADAEYCDVNEAFDKELHLGTSSGSGRSN
jgi:hypothetical protein